MSAPGKPMSAGLALQARLMLLAPWQWRRNDGSAWALRLYGALAVLLLGVPAAAALVWMPQRAAWAAVGGLAFIGLAVVWGLQIGALLRLDHPHSAHIVPGHTHALRAATLGLWLALVALCSGVTGMASWLLIGHGLHASLAAAVGAGAVLLFIALALRWWWLWLLLSAGFSFIGINAWRTLVFGSAAWMQQLWQAQPLGVTLGLLVAQGLCTSVLFGAGDNRHLRNYAGRERLRKFMAASSAGQKPALASYGRWVEWLGLPLQRLSDAWLAHVTARAQPTAGSVMTRAEFVLHGHQHWVPALGVVLFVQAVLLLCFVLAVQLSGVPVALFFEHGRVGISIGLTSMALSAVLSLPGALWLSRREQALLMLLPGMPQGVRLNRALAWRQLRHCLWVWSALLPTLVAMTWAGQGLQLAFVAMALPMSAWLWRDMSRLQAGRPAAAFGPILMCLLAGALSIFLLSRQPGALLPWALGLLLLSAGLLVWRWRCLLRLPQALPAGRLA